MVSQISQGVKVSVETFYQPTAGNAVEEDFMFAYRITLENHNSFGVQLLRRHWFIFDSLNEKYEVEGDGVIGVQPVIGPGERYQYISGCNLKSEIGSMHGFYFMENMDNGKAIDIPIPRFQMVVPSKLN